MINRLIEVLVDQTTINRFPTLIMTLSPLFEQTCEHTSY